MSEEEAAIMGTVTAQPETDGGKALINQLRAEFTLEVDMAHEDGNMTFVIMEQEE